MIAVPTDSWPDDGDTSGYDSFDDPPLEEDGLDLSGDDPTDDSFDDGYDLDDADEPTDETVTGDEPTDTVDTDETTVVDTDFTVETIDDEVVGSDPDAVDYGDSDAYEPSFPPELSLDPMPEPVDGQPWSDADLLGDVADTTSWHNMSYTPISDDLLAMDASDGGWNGLLTSSDPAVSSLARWWQA